MDAHSHRPRGRIRSFAFVAIVVGACASRPAATHVATTEAVVASATPSPSAQWQTLDPSGPPTNERELHAQLSDRRRDLLTQCDDVLDTLEARDRAAGSLPLNVATTVAAAALTGAVPVGPMNA